MTFWAIENANRHASGENPVTSANAGDVLYLLRLLLDTGDAECVRPAISLYLLLAEVDDWYTRMAILAFCTPISAK